METAKGSRTQNSYLEIEFSSAFEHDDEGVEQTNELLRLVAVDGDLEREKREAA